jgi:xanthine dehydrogenase YagR molybdenum-binding subunit
VLKVTGAADYAADHHPPGMLYAVLAVSTIARGRVAFLDVSAAKAHPRVVEVITPAIGRRWLRIPMKIKSAYVPA